ncbi:hypothetical protein [Okeania sp. SIO2B3]|uniref:hypothetical protein n=1 Tax=Okeania sp. SIO2B3 TaxID=2607784 RepID=UPI0013C15C0B|nr:hypothetical protein [Okeania sp. SIO2B3]NET41128.1 hypothetical protein [Okeania sp. SIO2B3]
MTKCLVCLEVNRYFLKLSDRLLSPFDFLPVFGADENFTIYIGSGKFVREFPRYLVYLEVTRYFLKLSDHLLSPFDFLPVFGADENFTSR